jgi:dienelactone hydrolase
MSTDLPYFVTGSFVLQPDEVQPERHGNVDLYVPESEGPFPAVILECGGPLPADAEWINPRGWPVYRGYGSLLAAHGVVGAPVQLPLHELTDFPRAAEALERAIDTVRADERVDADRIAIWFWCAGGPLISDWLRTPPEWLRCLALTYPLLASRPGIDLPQRFEPAEALAVAGNLPPIVLSRAGLEAPAVAKTVETFVAAAEKHQVQLEIIDVPTGFHGFDIVDHAAERIGSVPPGAVCPDFAPAIEDSRAAVQQALTFVLNALK